MAENSFVAEVTKASGYIIFTINKITKETSFGGHI